MQPIFFLTSHISLPCSILPHTQLLDSLSVIISDISVLVSNGANCLNLFHPILYMPNGILFDLAALHSTTYNAHTERSNH